MKQKECRCWSPYPNPDKKKCDQFVCFRERYFDERLGREVKTICVRKEGSKA